MTIMETNYKCDACGKVEQWGESVARLWAHIRVESVGFVVPKTRDQQDMHACSTACERALHLRLAGENPNQKQLEAEARAAWPDLAKRLDGQETAHRNEIDTLRAEKTRIELDLMRARADLSVMASTKASQPVTHDELRGLLRGVLGETVPADIAQKLSAMRAADAIPVEMCRRNAGVALRDSADAAARGEWASEVGQLEYAAALCLRAREALIAIAKEGRVS